MTADIFQASPDDRRDRERFEASSIGLSTITAQKAMRWSQSGLMGQFYAETKAERLAGVGPPKDVSSDVIAVMECCLALLRDESTWWQEKAGPSIQRLDDLLAMCVVHTDDAADVRAALEARPITVRFLQDMHAEVIRRFGELSGIELASGYDEQGDGFYDISAFVRLGVKSDEQRERFKQFKRERWYPRVGEPDHGIALRSAWQ